MSSKTRSRQAEASHIVNQKLKWRSGRNPRQGKNIRMNKNGFEAFEDFLTESEADISKAGETFNEKIDKENVSQGNTTGNVTELPSSALGTSAGVSSLHSTMGISSQTYNSQVLGVNPVAWYFNKNIGRRTGRNLKAGKVIRKNADGFENFADYLSDSDASTISMMEPHHKSLISTRSSLHPEEDVVISSTAPANLDYVHPLTVADVSQGSAADDEDDSYLSSMLPSSQSSHENEQDFDKQGTVSEANDKEDSAPINTSHNQASVTELARNSCHSPTKPLNEQSKGNYHESAETRSEHRKIFHSPAQILNEEKRKSYHESAESRTEHSRKCQGAEEITNTPKRKSCHAGEDIGIEQRRKSVAMEIQIDQKRKSSLYVEESKNEQSRTSHHDAKEVGIERGRKSSAEDIRSTSNRNNHGAEQISNMSSRNNHGTEEIRNEHSRDRHCDTEEIRNEQSRMSHHDTKKVRIERGKKSSAEKISNTSSRNNHGAEEIRNEHSRESHHSTDEIQIEHRRKRHPDSENVRNEQGWKSYESAENNADEQRNLDHQHPERVSENNSTFSVTNSRDILSEKRTCAEQNQESIQKSVTDYPENEDADGKSLNEETDENYYVRNTAKDEGLTFKHELVSKSINTQIVNKSHPSKLSIHLFQGDESDDCDSIVLVEEEDVRFNKTTVGNKKSLTSKSLIEKRSKVRGKSFGNVTVAERMGNEDKRRRNSTLTGKKRNLVKTSRRLLQEEKSDKEGDVNEMGDVSDKEDVEETEISREEHVESMSVVKVKGGKKKGRSTTLKKTTGTTKSVQNKSDKKTKNKKKDTKTVEEKSVNNKQLPDENKSKLKPQSKRKRKETKSQKNVDNKSNSENQKRSLHNGNDGVDLHVDVQNQQTVKDLVEVVSPSGFGKSTLSKTELDVAGSNIGSITKLDDPSGSEKIPSFGTRKRLSYSVAFLDTSNNEKKKRKTISRGSIKSMEELTENDTQDEHIEHSNAGQQIKINKSKPNKIKDKKNTSTKNKRASTHKTMTISLGDTDGESSVLEDLDSSIHKSSGSQGEDPKATNKKQKIVSSTTSVYDISFDTAEVLDSKGMKRKKGRSLDAKNVMKPSKENQKRRKTTGNLNKGKDTSKIKVNHNSKVVGNEQKTELNSEENDKMCLEKDNIKSRKSPKARTKRISLDSDSEEEEEVILTHRYEEGPVEVEDREKGHHKGLVEHEIEVQRCSRENDENRRGHEDEGQEYYEDCEQHESVEQEDHEDFVEQEDAVEEYPEEVVFTTQSQSKISQKNNRRKLFKSQKDKKREEKQDNRTKDKKREEKQDNRTKSKDDIVKKGSKSKKLKQTKKTGRVKGTSRSKKSDKNEVSRSDSVSQGTPRSHDKSDSHSPRVDTPISALTVTEEDYMKSGISHRTSRIRPVDRTTNVDHSLPHQETPLGPSPSKKRLTEAEANLTPILTQFGSTKRKKGRRVTISNIVTEQQFAPQSDSLGTSLSPETLPLQTSQPRRRSLMDVTDASGLLSINATPVHIFEVTGSQSPTIPTPKLEVPKLIKPSTAPDGLRRSSRIRCKPLAGYKGERAVYERRKSGFGLVGVESSQVELMLLKSEAEKRKRMQARKLKRRYQKTEKRLSIHAALDPDMTLSSDNECVVLDSDTGEEVSQECFLSKESQVFRGPTNQVPESSDPFIMSCVKSHEFFKAGVLIIRPFQEKPLQQVSKGIMTFWIEKGKVAITIHKSKKIGETGDFFCIPKGNEYHIKNLRKDEARLLFQCCLHD